jgi:uncharacterized protein
MKLLLFSDLHTNKVATETLIQRAQTVDVLVGAGYFANVRHNLHVCIDILKVVDRPTILVAGNNETTDELRTACRGWSSALILHGSSAVVDKVVFYGVGGGIPVTPFGAWSYDFSEEQAQELLASCPQNCVLVTHSPPKGAVDVSSSGKSIGSTAICDAIERVSPLLVVCGHVHASNGQQAMIGTVPVEMLGQTVSNGIYKALHQYI